MSTNVADSEITPPEAQRDLRETLDPVTERRAYLRKMRRRRRRLMLIGIPVAILVLLLAAKLLSMTVIANRTVSSYAEGDYETSLNSAQQQKILNAVEQWKAPFNTGTVYLQLGLNPEARAELEAALPLANGVDECPIRSNLAIAIERVGDTAATDGDAVAAAAAYEQALEVLAQAPGECPATASGEPMEETRVRLEEKQEEQGSEEGEPGEEDPSETGDAEQDQVDEINDLLDQNQDDRQDQIDQEDESDGAGGGGSDTPW